MLIYPFVVRTGLCSCNGMLKSEPEALVFLIQVKVTCPVINTRCSFPVFIKTFRLDIFLFLAGRALKKFVYLSIKYIQKVINQDHHQDCFHFH